MPSPPHSYSLSLSSNVSTSTFLPSLTIWLGVTLAFAALGCEAGAPFTLLASLALVARGSVGEAAADGAATEGDATPGLASPAAVAEGDPSTKAGTATAGFCSATDRSVA